MASMFRNKKSGDIISEGQLHELFPQVSFPAEKSTELLDTFGYDVVLSGVTPPFDPKIERLGELSIVEVDGKWTQIVEIVSLTVDEQTEKQAIFFAATKQFLEDAVQKHLNRTAQARGYDSIFAAATYDGDKNPSFAAEGKAFKDWRSDVWGFCITVLSDVETGKRALPSWGELESELPILSL